MRKRPSGTALIEIAEATEAAADPDAPNANYVAAMIRNARAIADRQAEVGDDAAKAEAWSELSRRACSRDSRGSSSPSR